MMWSGLQSSGIRGVYGLALRRPRPAQGRRRSRPDGASSGPARAERRCPNRDVKEVPLVGSEETVVAHCDPVDSRFGRELVVLEHGLVKTRPRPVDVELYA